VRIAVDECCTHALRREEIASFTPSYKRAAVSGAVAGFCSEVAAKSMKYHTRFENQQTLLSLRTLVSVVGGGIAGVLREADRVRRRRKDILKFDNTFTRMSGMSDTEVVDVLNLASPRFFFNGLMTDNLEAKPAAT
jgi:hypothetical protein